MLTWLKNNYIELKTDKCHQIVSGYKHEHAKIGTEKKILENRDGMLLGINIDNELKFVKYVLEIRTEAGRNFSALA